MWSIYWLVGWLSGWLGKGREKKDRVQHQQRLAFYDAIKMIYTKLNVNYSTGQRVVAGDEN